MSECVVVTLDVVGLVQLCVEEVLGEVVEVVVVVDDVPVRAPLHEVRGRLQNAGLQSGNKPQEMSSGINLSLKYG